MSQQTDIATHFEGFGFIHLACRMYVLMLQPTSIEVLVFSPNRAERKDARCKMQ